MKLSKLLFLIPVLGFIGSCHKKKDQTVNTVSTALVTTAPVTFITRSSAVSGGTVTDASGGNISARGVCWSINEFPTIDDVNDFKTIDGTGLGGFGSTMNNLLSNKTYYVRAYVTNEVGTGYGDHVVFTTLP
jgi:hypothetical protein